MVAMKFERSIPGMGSTTDLETYDQNILMDLPNVSDTNKCFNAIVLVLKK